MNTDLPALPEPSLLPCPFCGHTTPYFERMGTPRQSCIVACGDCGARHESSDEGTRSGSSWNTRAALAAQQPAAEPTDAQVAMLDPWMRPAAARELLSKVLAAAPAVQSLDDSSGCAACAMCGAPAVQPTEAKEQPAEAVALDIKWPPMPTPWRTVQDADGHAVSVFRKFQMRDYALAVLAAAPSAQPVAQFSGATVLPDGSAFSTASFPLPKDHWLYAPRGEWDNERDEYAECPQPILTNAQRDAVRTATRYAIRGATMCGQDQDFDPDALVLNVCYALCGPANGAVLPADAAAPSAPQTTKGDEA